MPGAGVIVGAGGQARRVTFGPGRPGYRDGYLGTVGEVVDGAQGPVPAGSRPSPGAATAAADVARERGHCLAAEVGLGDRLLARHCLLVDAEPHQDDGAGQDGEDGGDGEGPPGGG